MALKVQVWHSDSAELLQFTNYNIFSWNTFIFLGNQANFLSSSSKQKQIEETFITGQTGIFSKWNDQKKIWVIKTNTVQWLLESEVC